MTNPQTGKFGEPWRIEGPFLKDNNGNVLAELSHITDGQCSRLVDGVNALAEIPNPSAIPALLEAAANAVETMAFVGMSPCDQYELREAIQAVIPGIELPPYNVKDLGRWKFAEALRAVKPQQQETSRPCAKCGQQFVTNYEGPSRELISICNQCWPWAIAMAAERGGSGMIGNGKWQVSQESLDDAIRGIYPPDHNNYAQFVHISPISGMTYSVNCCKCIACKKVTAPERTQEHE